MAMGNSSDIIYSLGLIAFGLISGYIYRNIRIQQDEAHIKRLRRKIQALALLIVNPIAFGGAIWALDLSDLRIISLPFLGAFAIILGGLIAYYMAKFLGLSRNRTGVFVTCGGFTNIGSIGSLITFFLLGETAVAIMPFYKLFETFIYYGIGFPFAKSMSNIHEEQEPITIQIIRVLSDKYVLVALSSMVIGLGLNMIGYKRPVFYSSLNSVLIPFGTVLLLFSIGMAMRFVKMRDNLREAFAISIIKFIIVPSSVYFAGKILGLDTIDNGIPLKVSIVLASMPVAFMAMVPPTIYDLDVDLANTAWFVTTVLLILVVPALRLVL
jgi:predicted permease